MEVDRGMVRGRRGMQGRSLLSGRCLLIYPSYTSRCFNNTFVDCKLVVKDVLPIGSLQVVWVISLDGRIAPYIYVL